MSETPWTPGPWVVDTDWPNNRHHACEIISGGIGHPFHEHRALANVVVKVDGGSYPRGEANARLIAAAPELAEALDNIMMALDLPGDHCELANAKRQAIAALAKARGETP
jgi:hypothetical protein